MGQEATETICSLIEKIVLVPKDDRLIIDLYGEIGTMLKLASAKKGRDVLGPVSEQLVMVAGVPRDNHGESSATNRMRMRRWGRASGRATPSVE